MKIGRFLFGAAVGAGAALLVAPRKGEDTREMVYKKINQLTDGGAQDVYERARVTVTEKVDQVRPLAEQKLDNLQAKTTPVADDVKARINETRDRLAEQIVNGQKRAAHVSADVSDVAEEIVQDIKY